jgi:hypothetical protein
MQSLSYFTVLMSIFTLSDYETGYGAGADPGFQVRGGAHLKKLHRALHHNPSHNPIR